MDHTVGPDQDMPDVYPSNQATIISTGGTEFLAEVTVIEEELPAKEGVQNAVVIFRIRGHEEASSTGLTFVWRDAQELKEAGNVLMLTGVRPHVMEVLKRAEIIDIIGEENVFPAQPGYGAATDAALEPAQKWLASRPKDKPAPDGDSPAGDDQES